MAKFHRELSLEEKNEIADLAVTGGESAMIPAELPPREKPAKISQFLDSPESVDPDQARSLSFTLGSLYGVLIEQVYGWRWGVARFDDGEERFGVFSPDRKFAVLVHELFYNHLIGARVSRFALLFELIGKGLPKPPITEGVTILA